MDNTDFFQFRESEPENKDAAASSWAGYQRILAMLAEKVVPGEYPECMNDMTAFSNPTFRYSPYITLDANSLLLREQFLTLGSCALIADDWIHPLSVWVGKQSCLEIMSGTGMLSKALSDHGVCIRATDDLSWGHPREAQWTEVEPLDCVEAIEKYGADIDYVICSWPPFDDDAAFRALQQMRKTNPKAQMIYIGEAAGGACADDQFFDAAEKVISPLFYKAVRKYKRCYGLKDQPMLLK